jgi:hypothetical protein
VEAGLYSCTSEDRTSKRDFDERHFAFRVPLRITDDTLWRPYGTKTFSTCGGAPPADFSLVASALSNIKRAKAVTEAAWDKLARTNQTFEKTRQLLHASEEIVQHTRARREYAAEHRPSAVGERKLTLRTLKTGDDSLF